MKLSIITICLNEKDVEKTCKSVVEQVFQDFEWIVIDGGSNKKTLDILNKYKHRMNFFISEKDAGIYNAMNKGIKLATGEYLHFLNAGDTYYRKNSVEKIHNKLTGEDIIAGNVILLKKDNTTELLIPELRYLKNDFINKNLCHQQTFIKRSSFDKYGLYNEDYKIISDWEKWVQIFSDVNSSYKRINDVVSIYKMDGISNTMEYLHEKERYTAFKYYFPDYKYKYPRKTRLKFINTLLSKLIRKVRA